MSNNIVLKTDSYKLNHWNQYPDNTEAVYSYFEARKGAKFPYTVFFGLQGLIKRNLLGAVVTQAKIEVAASLSKAHFGSETMFNRAGWEYILNNFGGKLPLRIRAVPEGYAVPIDNILMDVENTGGKPTAFLTNALESLLTHVWHPSTVATLSRSVKLTVKKHLELTSDNLGGLNFMLHDFGYRGVSSDESAEFGGAGHLVNFLGTDTVVAMMFIDSIYGEGKGNFDGIAYSVPATEHSIMTALGREGEVQVVGNLLKNYPKGILSVVADSFDYYAFVEEIAGKTYKKDIVTREGVFVIRPDSVTPEHPTPEALMVWTMRSLWDSFGGTINSKNYKVINPKVRVLWGDGIDAEGIEKILVAVGEAGFSVENIATFGMGGGLLQKVNRDTQRFAFKSSAQKRDGVWHDVYKQPRDTSKASKRGRLKLVWADGAHRKTMVTVPESDPRDNILQVVFEDGVLVKEYDFKTVRENAEATTQGY